MMDAKRLNLALGAVAVAVLVISFSAYAYTLKPRGDADILVVNGVDYEWEHIFEDFEAHEFTASEQNYTGISLEELLLDAGVVNPAGHTYRFVARDPYQQEVGWADIQGGYLIDTGPNEDDFHRAIFPTTAHTFWVYDLASIEVV